ncbi:hypothetical protein CEXT_592121 [Caerostris extrusa]|uniref:Uncharacterized protein n=1 Tax=Caerostris extrusa TaxID=172846 RepID=A0AAV4VXH5_CAEEX|nr:hypothetical protein CEXT_592121 [Caerostris extrusa]
MANSSIPWVLHVLFCPFNSLFELNTELVEGVDIGCHKRNGDNISFAEESDFVSFHLPVHNGVVVQCWNIGTETDSS